MVNPQMVMYERFNLIQTVVDRLVREANARVVFHRRQEWSADCRQREVENIDTTFARSLTAGNIAATGGDRQTAARKRIRHQFHEARSHIHIQLVGNESSWW